MWRRLAQAPREGESLAVRLRRCRDRPARSYYYSYCRRLRLTLALALACRDRIQCRDPAHKYVGRSPLATYRVE